MFQYLLLCAFAVPGIRALVVPVIEAAAEEPKCLDITHCRTIWNIIWTCFVTIFACTWVSIHRNVVLDSGSLIDIPALLDRLRITALTMLAPEYTLAWAVRQWIVAHEISKDLNKLQPVLPHVRVDSGVGTIPAMPAMATIALQEMIEDREVVGPSSSIREVSRFPKNDPWTTTHGFCSLMGGFYYFEGDEPQYPVSREDLEHIVKIRPSELPTKLDIEARSKSDAFSKTVTVLQTLWFVMQCIARAIQHLPITNLEIATLAYTTFTFAMYYFWFQKPLNVSRPIRLTRPKWDELMREGPESQRSVSSEHLPEMGWRIQIKNLVRAVVGTQDDEVQLPKLRQVPTFYAGEPEEQTVILADAIAIAAGTIFGAVHCIAWSFTFPSQAEQLLWRISAVITTVIPFLSLVFLVLIAFELNWMAKPVLIVFTVVRPFYLVARAVLLVLTFTTLRDLPPAAYEAIHWMSFLPHV